MKRLVRTYINSIQNEQRLERESLRLAQVQREYEAQLRRVRSRRMVLPDLRSHDGREVLQPHVLDPKAPWHGLEAAHSGIPGVISDEEKKYYEYVSRFYSGAGAAVELGPWLGCSTWHLLRGLEKNPAFSSQKLVVFDDFIWRSWWMDEKVEAKDRVGPFASFRPVFERYTASFAGRMDVRQRKIANAEGNEHLSPLDWTDGPIELLLVDCGRTIHVNQSWYDRLSPHFIPNRTLVMMQDWRTFFELPARHYNQPKQFTDGLGGALELVHELEDAGLATFLFRGKSSAG